jgi:UDP-glucose:(heptosyl)LPS alpha-1,3-glucosyltransferase
MKVAVIIERYDVSLGGAEWLVSELVLALSQLGIDADILAAHGDNTAANIHILCGTDYRKRMSLKSFAKAVRHYLHENHYDIVHSVLPLVFVDVYQPPGGSFDEASIRNAASYRNRFMVSYKKATASLNRRRTEMLSAEKKLCQDPHGPVITALSNYVKDQFKNRYDLGNERLALIPNGVKTDSEVNIEDAKKLRKQIYSQLALKESDKPIFFLFGANNFRLKGLSVLIEAMALLNKSGILRQPYLIVAGRGNINKYQYIAKKSNVDEKIVFLGHQPSIQNALSISDVAVLPTYYDPCSRFILEALAAGKPVITTRFNGATDSFVNNRHGKVIDSPDDVSALAEAVDYFTNTDNIQKASQAIAADNLKEKISIRRVAEQLISIYKSILENRR